MCGFSAKGPWCLEINGVPYGAYTELQARKIGTAHKKQNPTDTVLVFAMRKLADVPKRDYTDSILAGRVGG